MQDPVRVQAIAIGPQHGWNYRYTLASFSEGKQGVRRAALKENVWLDAADAAGGVEQPAH